MQQEMCFGGPGTDGSESIDGPDVPIGRLRASITDSPIVTSESLSIALSIEYSHTGPSRLSNMNLQVSI